MLILHTANNEENVKTKGKELFEARNKLVNLKRLEQEYSSITLQDSSAVEEIIQVELDALKKRQGEADVEKMKAFFLNLGIYLLRALYGFLFVWPLLAA